MGSLPGATESGERETTARLPVLFAQPRRNRRPLDKIVVFQERDGRERFTGCGFIKALVTGDNSCSTLQSQLIGREILPTIDTGPSKGQVSLYILMLKFPPTETVLPEPSC